MTHLALENLLFAATLLGMPLLSQSPTPASGQAPTRDFARELAAAPHTLPWPANVLTDIDGDGTIWASAQSWKASFAADGATFRPFLGADAPSCAATFALRAARCGGNELSLHRATARLQGQQIDFERGAVGERFELTTRGLEQQFVLSRLPSREELQIDVAVTTGLTISADADGHTLLGDHGGLRYGRATAIDANGNTCELATTLVDGAFRITVPAAFVATAALPLVVDPLIGTIRDLTTATTELTATDIAYDQSLGQFFVCYERAFSVTDHDVYVVYTDANLMPQGLLTIDYTSSYWARPRIATLEAQDTACVVAETSTGNVSPFAIKSRVFLGGPNPLLQPVSTLSNGSYDYVEPDIGGDANAVGPNHFLVGYECRSPNQFDGYVRVHLLDALGAVTTTVTNQTSQTGRLQRVAISKTCGAIGGGSEGWALVYRYSGFNQTIGELRVAFFTRAGAYRALTGGGYSQILTVVTPNEGSEWDVSSPTDDNEGRTVLCAETRVDQVTNRGAIYGTVIDWHGNTLVPNTALAEDTYDYRQPVVDSDGYRFALGHVKAFSATDHDVRLKLFSRVGNQLLQADSAYTSTLIDFDTQPAICAMAGQHNQYAVAWSHSDGAPWVMEAVRYEGIGQGIITSRATGCGPVGLTVSGSVTIGQTFTVSPFGPGSILGVIAGTAISVPIGPCPGCILGVDGTLLIGNQLPITVPFDPSFLGATISCQGVQIDFAAASCLGLFQLGSTKDLTVL